MFKENPHIDIDTAEDKAELCMNRAQDAYPCAEVTMRADGLPVAHCGDSSALASAPSSNYGAKVRTNTKQDDDDYQTGERIILKMRRGRVVPMRQLDAIDTAPQHAALIDALSFSVKPASHIEQPSVWVLDELSRFIPIKQCSIKPRKGGYAGYRFSADIEGIGLIAWGGEQQRGAVTFSMMGGGCSAVFDMQGLRDWLEKHHAKLKRVDVAHDDFEGKNINIAWTIEQYHAGGFNAGGRKPKHACFGAWLDRQEDETKGLTLAIGSRGSGKYCRIYEKGKQLGDKVSQWTRVEVEWRDQDRDIPYDILTNPGQYLAGAYPCLSGLSAVQSIIKTVSQAASIVYDKAVEHARQQAGKVINVMVKVEDDDSAAVVEKLIREGVPKRIEPWSYHIKHNPDLLLGAAP